VEYQAEDAFDRHRDKINAGIQKWKQFKEALEPAGKKPVLFIMTEDTKASTQIAERLRTLPEFPEGTVLRIDTNARGEISEALTRQKELEALRVAAREVDQDENPYTAIVSVLMLREGCDVRNVVVIVPLRKYTAKAQILPEQTLGRGLRRMWPMASGSDLEQIVVIEHAAFRQFWDKEIQEEGVNLPWVPVDILTPDVKTVLVDRSKLEYDIEIPVLTPAFLRTAANLDRLDIYSLPRKTFQVGIISDDPIQYQGRDMRTMEIVDRDEFQRDFPVDPIGYVNVITRLVLREARLLNMADSFAKVGPKVKRYIEEIMFGGLAMDDQRVMMRLNFPDAKEAIFNAFVDAIHRLAVEEVEVRPQGEVIRVSDANAFPTSRKCVEARKTAFDKVPCDSDLEQDFARWLDAMQDVLAFAKNETAVHFSMEYISERGGLRTYRPDFLIRTAAANYIVETKGWEDLEVARKDLRAVKWCHDATALSGTEWRYLKVTDALFRSTNWASFQQLGATVAVR
jgi:type III restriction enzyme